MTRITFLPRVTTAAPNRNGHFAVLLLTPTSLSSHTKAVKLCVYDYDLYNDSQVRGQGADPQGFWETNAEYFDGTKSQLPQVPQHHAVEPGSGVLASVDLTFHFGQMPLTPTISTGWYVDEVAPAAPLPSPGPEVEVRAPIKKGSTYTWAVIARLAWPGTDYAKIRQGGVTVRRLAFRIFEPDGQRVLLSSRNPNDCAVATAAGDGGWFRASLIHGATQASPKSPPPPSPASPPAASRVPNPDPTGYFVELVPGLDKTPQTQLVVSDNERTIGASGLYLNAAGDGVVGWYYMLDDVRTAPILRDHLSDNRLQQSLRFTMGSATEYWYDHGALIAHPLLPELTNLPADSRLPTPPQPNAIRAYYYRSTTAQAPDPTALLDGRLFNNADAVFEGYIVFEYGPMGILEIQLNLRVAGQIRTFTFSRLYGRSRLPEAIFDIIGASQAAMTAAEYRSAVLAETAPIPPGTRTFLMRKAGDDLTQICSEYAQYVDSGPNDLMATRSFRIAGFLLRASDVVTQFFQPCFRHYTDDLVQLLAADVISRTIFIGGNNRVMREVLYEMLGELLELEMKLANRGRGLPEADFEWLLQRYPAIAPVAGGRRAGLAAVGINPKDHTYRYKIDFFSQSLSGGALIKGAGGGFRVEISRFDPGAPSGAAPAYRIEYYGAFLGIGAGAGFGYDLNKGESAGPAGSAGKPVSCDCYSTARLEPGDFVDARFTTGAIIGPTGKVGTGIGVGFSAGWSITFFELKITHRSPNIVLDATIERTPSKPSVSPELVNGLKNRVQEIKKQDPKKISTIGVSVDLYAMSKSWGVFLTHVSQIPKPNKANPPEDGPGKQLAFIHTGVPVMAFEVGKADIRTFLIHRMDLLLAMYRTMFEAPGWVRIEGYASPEWGKLDRDAAKDANQALAERRTANTQDIIEQALGAPGGPIVNADKDIRHAGYGDAFQARITTDLHAPKMRQGYRVILDPFCPAARTVEGIDRVATEQREVYPTMRRVDISADGVFIIRLGAR